MSTRAEKFTQLQKVPELFSDFTSDLTPHPVTADLIRSRDDKSIKQSLKNLIFTINGERPFQSRIGSAVNRSLFEINDDFAAEDLADTITETITINEPRVALNRVVVSPDPENYGVSVSILYTIINSQIPQSLDLVLRRVR